MQGAPFTNGPLVVATRGPPAISRAGRSRSRAPRPRLLHLYSYLGLVRPSLAALPSRPPAAIAYLSTRFQGNAAPPFRPSPPWQWPEKQAEPKLNPRGIGLVQHYRHRLPLPGSKSTGLLLVGRTSLPPICSPPSRRRGGEHCDLWSTLITVLTSSVVDESRIYEFGPGAPRAHCSLKFGLLPCFSQYSAVLRTVSRPPPCRDLSTRVSTDLEKPSISGNDL